MINQKTLSDLATALHAKLCDLSDEQCMQVGYKAGVLSSPFVMPVCDYLPDYLVDHACREWKRDIIGAGLNLENLKKSIRLAGF